MNLEERIIKLEDHLVIMKLYANSYYGILNPFIPTYFGINGEEIDSILDLIDMRLQYKMERVSLLKKLERKLKLQKINEKSL
jgi:hypothetical protein